MPELPVVTEVQKPVEGQLERAPGAGPRSIDEAWRDFKSGVIKHSAERPPEQKDTGLNKLTPEQLEHWNKTGEVPKTKEAKEPAEVGKEPEANAKPATEAEGDGKQAAKTEDRAERQQTPHDQSYEQFLNRASKEPDFDKMVERVHERIFPDNAEGYARYQVLGHALTQINNSDDVVYFLARPENSSTLLKMQGAPPEKIAQAVHLISAELRFGGRSAKRSEEPRPRAPRPPTEVGGRSSGPWDAEADAIRRNDFGAVEAVWNQRLKQQGRD